MQKDNDVVSIRDWAAVLGAAIGAFMAILDIQVINASLREIQGALSLSMTEGSWISTSYLIAEIIVIPMTAALSVAFGTRRYFVFNATAFLMSSILCGLSWNLTSMIIFRILQGISGGVLIPMSFQTILTKLPLSKRNIGLAIFGLTVTLAPTLGPTLGGWLTDQFDWRFIFFINVIPGILVILLLMYGFEKSILRVELLKKFDFLGAFFLSLALGTMTYMLEEGARKEWFEDTHIRIAFLISLFSFAGFFITMLVKKNPLLQLNLLLERNFGLSAIITVISAMALYGGVYATSIYLGQIQNYSAQQIGTTMMWIGIPQIFVMPLLPFLMNRVDLRILALFGFILFTCSNYLNGFMDFGYAGEHFRTSLILRALGQPLFMIPLSAMAMSRIAADKIGDASAIYNTLRNIGGSIGISVVSTFLVTRVQNHMQAHTGLIDIDSPQLVQDYLPLQLEYLTNSIGGWAEAKMLTMKHILEIAYRDSLIQSFNDAFLLITVGLIFCSLLVVLLKKTIGGTNLGGGH